MQNNFPKRLFGTFPKIHPFWYRHQSLIQASGVGNKSNASYACNASKPSNASNASKSIASVSRLSSYFLSPSISKNDFPVSLLYKEVANIWDAIRG